MKKISAKTLFSVGIILTATLLPLTTRTMDESYNKKKLNANLGLRNLIIEVKKQKETIITKNAKLSDATNTKWRKEWLPWTFPIAGGFATYFAPNSTLKKVLGGISATGFFTSLFNHLWYKKSRNKTLDELKENHENSKIEQTEKTASKAEKLGKILTPDNMEKIENENPNKPFLTYHAILGQLKEKVSKYDDSGKNITKEITKLENNNKKYLIKTMTQEYNSANFDNLIKSKKLQDEAHLIIEKHSDTRNNNTHIGTFDGFVECDLLF